MYIKDFGATDQWKLFEMANVFIKIYIVSNKYIYLPTIVVSEKIINNLPLLKMFSA